MAHKLLKCLVPSQSRLVPILVSCRTRLLSVLLAHAVLWVWTASLLCRRPADSSLRSQFNCCFLTEATPDLQVNHLQNVVIIQFCLFLMSRSSHSTMFSQYHALCKEDLLTQYRVRSNILRQRLAYTQRLRPFVLTFVSPAAITVHGLTGGF